MAKMDQNDRKWQILGQVWLLEPNVDWTKVMGVVPEQIPGDSGCIWCIIYVYHSFYRQKPLLFTGKMTKMDQNDPKWQILGQVWVLEPSVDWKKVSGVVPEQIPDGSGCIWCIFYLYHSLDRQKPLLFTGKMTKMTQNGRFWVTYGS